MGKLDQFAKNLFAEETPGITHGAVAYWPPSELNLSEVRLDGRLLVNDSSRLLELPAPWSEARACDEIVLEIKMQGDHLNMCAIDRALLRRQAQQVLRAEEPQGTDSPLWEGETPLWLSASHVPEVLRRRRDLNRVAPGCYHVGPAWFSFLWIAANELPLREELIPFLVARSGRALDEFGFWVKTRRPPEWLVRMLEYLPMSTTVHDELLRFFMEKTEDPEIRARKTQLAQSYLRVMAPEVYDELIEKGLEKGLAHQFERRLGHRLSDEERSALQERLHRLGPERLGDVVLDLDAKALAAWLADPEAK